MILLDSDILVDVARDFLPALEWLGELNQEEIVIPGFVFMELIQGCRNLREQKKIEKSFGHFKIFWPSADVCQKALELFSSSHLKSGIGIIDSLIAETAIDLNQPLHTFNQKHYMAAKNLKTYQPYSKA